MKQLPKILVSLLFVIYCISTEVTIGAYFIVQYFVGLILVRLITHTKSDDVTQMYSLFYSIYGLLTLVTQFELISVVDEVHYYIHNDAADAFYPIITSNAIENKWSEMLSATLLNPLFSNYPLSALIMGSIGKIAMAFDVSNLRLFLRLHEFLFASIIVALITDIPSKFGVYSEKNKKYIFFFSLCSYLYITSAIFTRDTHVCLAYSLLGYVFLLPKCKFRLLWFVLLVAISAGFRPTNGILAATFPVVYYLSDKKSGGLVAFFLLIALVALYSMISSIFVFGAESLDYYSELTSSNTGGIFALVYSLPFPINQIGLSVYMLLVPLPIVAPLLTASHGSIMNLPYCLSPYIMALLYCSTFHMAICGFMNSKRHRNYVYLCIFLFIAIVYGSPDIRRAFAAVPCLFMIFICYLPQIPKSNLAYIRKKIWPAIFCISSFLTIYVLIKS